MRNYANPFRSRASEQHRDAQGFLRTFAPGVLQLLPQSPWDRLVIIRSAPGAGKTSLMRLFTLPSLRFVHERQDDLTLLHQYLSEIDALDETGPRRLGVLLNLERDYRSLVDVGAPEEASTRLFFRLLDARLITAVVRSALEYRGLRFPEDAARLSLRADPEVRALAERLGGLNGDELVGHAGVVETDMLDVLDSLLPVDWDRVNPAHGELHALRVLSESRIEVDGHTLELSPLIMFDDGHELSGLQRDALLRQLRRRSLRVSRWYSERFEALSHQDIMAGDIEGRDFELLQLESAARRLRGRGRVAHDGVLLEIGNLRAARPLTRYADETLEFTELVDFDEAELLIDRAEDVTGTLRSRIADAGGGDPRYRAWLGSADALHGYHAAVRLRQLEILIARDQRRRQGELFDVVLPEEDLPRQLAAVAEPARLFLAHEFKLPYYAGPERLARLASHNVEQFLTICGDLFELMLAQITLGKRPKVGPAAQDGAVRRASESYWRQLPRRLTDGEAVSQLLREVAAMAVQQTYRSTAPYSPGVTGFAITMEDRARLLDPAERGTIPGADRLFTALASASAFNVLTIELDSSVKGKQFMVMYLNRLLCPRLRLPLGRGGFREQRLEIAARWMLESGAPRVPPGVEATEPLIP